jgi:AcrR family transcriptional regulator
LQQSKTARQIQKAAEALFAEQGFSETTMRQITSAADVNLASVNYHFGSKQGLIQSVADTYLVPLCDRVQAGVDARLKSSSDIVELDELIELLMRSLLSVNEGNTYALPMFSRLLDLAYMQQQDELRDHIIRLCRDKLRVFLDLLRNDMPPMQDDEFFWRLHFLLGSMIFTFSNYHTLIKIERSEYDKEAEMAMIFHRMLPVISAGFLARSEKTHFCKV